MKKLNVVILMVSLLLPGYLLGEGKPFKISGKLAGEWEGTIWLVAQNGEQVDTLGESAVIGGRFRIEGQSDTPHVAVLSSAPKGKQGFFLLEPGFTYKVQERENGKLMVEGGRSQEYLNHYLQIIDRSSQKIKPLTVKMNAASDKMHMRTAAELKAKISDVSAATRDVLKEYTGRHRNTLFSAFILTNGWERMKLEALEQCYEQLTEQERMSAPGQKLASRLATLKHTEVKATAPDFTLRTPDGKEVSLYKVKGKLKIIDFWASWCGPCRLENPNMVKLYQDFKDRGLAIVSVSLDTDKEKWVEAIHKDGMPWIHVSSLQGWKDQVVKMYDVDAVPAVFVLDEDNRILAKQLRGKKLREFVTRYMQEYKEE